MTAILKRAAETYGVDPSAFQPLGAFESEVFAFDGPAGPSVLKVVSVEHRTAELVQAEVDWLLALVEAGVPVAKPIPTSGGGWTERLNEEGRVLVAFERAPGATAKPGDWTAARLEAWGALLGRLHAHSRTWTPPGPRRKSLQEQTYLGRARKIEDEDPEFARAATALASQAEPLLGRGPDVGLIHADLHHGNLLLEAEGWTAIDFDDSAYGSYAFDLAMPLYYAIWAQSEREPLEVASEFLPPFLRGFRRYGPDPAGGAEAISTSLAVRQAELVLALRFKLPPDAWSDSLRRTAKRFRDRTVEGIAPLSRVELGRWFEG